VDDEMEKERKEETMKERKRWDVPSSVEGKVRMLY
jgi:hypothetical protein